MLIGAGRVIFFFLGVIPVGDVLRLSMTHRFTLTGVSVDHSLPLDAPLPSELIEDSEVEPRALRAD